MASRKAKKRGASDIVKAHSARFKAILKATGDINQARGGVATVVDNSKAKRSKRACRGKNKNWEM